MPRKDLVQYRSGTAAAWTAANPVLAKGEPGHESDTGNVKVGDGTSAWALLPYVGAGSAPASPISSVRKAVDTTRNNTAALAADPELTIPVAANAVYEVRGQVIYSSSTVADLLMGWTGPTGATFEWTPDSLNVATTGTLGQVHRARTSMVGNAGAGGVATGGGGRAFALPRGILSIGGTAGSLTFTWAQSTAEATDTTVYALSSLVLTRLA